MRKSQAKGPLPACIKSPQRLHHGPAGLRYAVRHSTFLDPAATAAAAAAAAQGSGSRMQRH
jgi:hypothetical protein